MSAETTPVVSADQQRAEIYSHMFEPREGKSKAIALGIAIVLHLIVLVIHFPEFKSKVEPKKENIIVVKKYRPPPPKVERKQIVKKKFTKKVPIPDPTPDEPEPIREPEPEIEPVPIPPDAEFLIGVPEAPPPGGPLLAGAGGVTNPVLVHRTDPEYPELARTARMEGRVILQAIVNKDGTVSEPNVLSSTRKGVGFEEAAMSAVTEWRYEPALQGDREVDVYFTIIVTFSLN